MIKKKYIALIILIIVIAFFYIFKEVNYGGLSSEEILEGIQPGINEFCQYLQDNEIHSACATCVSDNYTLVKNFSTPLPIRNNQYIIEKKRDLYYVTVKHYVIYGWNTRMGSLETHFILNNQGEILEKTFPEDTCK